MDLAIVQQGNGIANTWRRGERSGHTIKLNSKSLKVILAPAQSKFS